MLSASYSRKIKDWLWVVQEKFEEKGKNILWISCVIGCVKLDFGDWFVMCVIFKCGWICFVAFEWVLSEIGWLWIWSGLQQFGMSQPFANTWFAHIIFWTFDNSSFFGLSPSLCQFMRFRPEIPAAVIYFMYLQQIFAQTSAPISPSIKIKVFFFCSFGLFWASSARDNQLQTQQNRKWRTCSKMHWN